MESDDQSNIPTKPVPVPGAGEPSQGLPMTDSILGAMLGFGRSQAGGAW